MTFYEAALRVLESAGRPLSVQEITAQSISQSLLSHVGKMPEQTMLSRLAAMARRNRDRKVIVTAKDTFALVDWGIPEDAAALAQTGVVEPNPEEDLPPYRPVERHPEPRSDNVRSAGRGEKRRRRDEEDDGSRRKRRYPPVPEVCFEILSESPEPLKASEIIEKARSRELCGEELSEQSLLTYLLEDNQRRIDAGRRPQFLFNKDTQAVSLERAGAPSELPAQELQAAFAAALGIPLENGRPVLPRREQAPEASKEDLAALSAIKAGLKDARRNMARVLRKRLSELDAFQFEKACGRMLTAFGFRELKVAKRNNLGPLLTARKREGSVELRYAVRLIKGNPGIDRKAVQDLRRDMGHYAAQVGILLSAGDVRGDGRGEAQSNGALAMVWCGEALADKFLDAKAGVSVETIELFELDERFFDQVKVEAEEAQKRREERMKDRDRDQRRDRPPRGEGQPGGSDAITDENPAVTPDSMAAVAEGSAPAPAAAMGDEGDEGDDGEGDDEGDDELDAADAAQPGGQPGAPGQPGAEGEPRRKRRRRRRGRRGRGRGEGGPGQPGQPGQQQQGQPGASAAPSGGGESSAPPAPPAEAAAPPPPPPPPAPTGGGDAQES